MEADLRYPVGKFHRPETLSADERRAAIDAIAEAPARLRAAIAGLDAGQLDTPYRPGGWTVRQLVHHVPDSHMNAYVRFKLAATEEEPTIKTYEEARWAELADAKTAPIEPSLALLENLHKRWVVFLRSLAPEDWSRKFRHPELGTMSLEQNLALYAWHGRHHVAHVTTLRERQNWK
ncbi:MAG TPA: putative metal-dependent hydrolase [Candidatus Limnocylindrales bacterium]|nr:putative metal-dependent hydrolase [Candidatus Limnocylindrales bacterium]